VLEAAKDKAEVNLWALELGAGFSYLGPWSLPVRDPNGKKFLNGAQGAGAGTIAAGCHFLSSYHAPAPGKPSSTGSWGSRTRSPPINMALGASYAGVRPMVTTSDGGFALIVEGFSLSGMIETSVVHPGQRSGPGHRASHPHRPGRPPVRPPRRHGESDMSAPSGPQGPSRPSSSPRSTRSRPSTFPRWRAPITGFPKRSSMSDEARDHRIRGLPPGGPSLAAAGIKIANKALVVIAELGGGDIYGEGGNHLLHSIRRNFRYHPDRPPQPGLRPHERTGRPPNPHGLASVISEFGQ